MPQQRTDVAKIYMLESAAKHLGVSKKTILRLIKATGIEPKRIGQRNMLLFTPDMVETMSKALSKR